MPFAKPDPRMMPADATVRVGKRKRAIGIGAKRDRVVAES